MGGPKTCYIPGESHRFSSTAVNKNKMRKRERLIFNLLKYTKTEH